MYVILDSTDDLFNPVEPVKIGSYALPGSGSAISIVGNLGYVADRSAGMSILDFSCMVGCLANLGDVSLNNQISAIDAALVLRAVVGMSVLTPSEFCRADVTKDNLISSLDAAYILMCVTGNCGDLPPGLQISCTNHYLCL